MKKFRVAFEKESRWISPFKKAYLRNLGAKLWEVLPIFWFMAGNPAYESTE